VQQAKFLVLREKSRRMSAWLQALVLTSAGLTPLIVTSAASAAPILAERELQSTTSEVSTTTDLTWVFDTTADVADIEQIEIEFCDSPVGTCNTTKTPALAASPAATLSGFSDLTVTSTDDVNGTNGGTLNQIDIVLTTPGAGISLDEATVSLEATDVTNNATVNASYYTRMRIYSDTGTTLVWEGVFAQSTSQTLTVSARVQERLDFCVGATTVDDATTSVASDCSAVAGTNVDLGIIETGNTNVSPVPVLVTIGDNENGVAMIRTNAALGASVDYKAILESGSGQLKIVGATCSGTAFTDQCFNSVGTTQDEIDAGTEEFGMVVAGINCGSSPTVGYTCVFAAGTYNLIRDNDYDGVVAGQDDTTYVADSGAVGATTTAAYAWLDDGVADTIASSTASAVKVIDDETMILKFAATASSTTPTGSYQVQADFIATTTF
jgi:hypothetical protein